MSATAQINFSPTPAGVAEAQAVLDRFKAGLAPTRRADEPETPEAAPATNKSPAVAVAEGTGPESRTRELLKVLPGDATKAITPAEIGELLRRNDDGSALRPAQVRAVLRNEKRIEHRLREAGTIDREVVVVDFSRYDAEGSARYYVRMTDREDLDKAI